MSDSSSDSSVSFCENSEFDESLLNKLTSLSIADKPAQNLTNCKTNSINLNNIKNMNNNTASNNANTNERKTIPVLDIKNLSVIPNFDGNPNKLHRFINATEAILTHYYDDINIHNFQNILLLNGILSKLEGRAEEVVAINGTNEWDTIKNTLIQNFGDQRDENCLNQDLVNLRQKANESSYEFYEKVIHLLNTICNYVELRCEPGQRLSKRDFFTKQALKTFLAGLKDPLGPTIRAMRPSTLAEALQFITEEDNIKYYQKSFHSQPATNKNFNTQDVRNFSVLQTHNSNPRYFSRPTTANQFPRGPINIQSNPKLRSNKFPTNSQVFGKPNNVWKPNPNAAQPKPTPMSVSTRNTQPPNFRGNNYFQNYAQKPTFRSEELFATEVEEPEYDPDYYDDKSTENQEQTEDVYSENFIEDPMQNEET